MDLVDIPDWDFDIVVEDEDGNVIPQKRLTIDGETVIYGEREDEAAEEDDNS